MEQSTKFTQSDIQKIKEAQTLIQDLENRQAMTFSVLLLNLPDLTKPERDKLFDYCYNNHTHTLSLGEDGLKIEEILTVVDPFSIEEATR